MELFLFEVNEVNKSDKSDKKDSNSSVSNVILSQNIVEEIKKKRAEFIFKENEIKKNNKQYIYQSKKPIMVVENIYYFP
jgi:hypothetical protein